MSSTSAPDDVERENGGGVDADTSEDVVATALDGSPGAQYHRVARMGDSVRGGGERRETVCAHFGKRARREVW